MEVEKNQTTKPWGFYSPLHKLQCGIKILANKQGCKFIDLQDGGLSWNLLKFEGDEDE